MRVRRCDTVSPSLGFLEKICVVDGGREGLNDGGTAGTKAAHHRLRVGRNSAAIAMTAAGSTRNRPLRIG